MSHRFSDLLDHGVGRARGAADELQHRLRKDGRDVIRKARHGYEDGRDRLITAEEAMVRVVRENPGIVAGFVLVLVGLFVGGLLLRIRRRREEEDLAGRA